MGMLERIYSLVGLGKKKGNSAGREFVDVAARPYSSQSVYDWSELMRSYIQDSPWLRGIVSTIAMSVAMVAVHVYRRGKMDAPSFRRLSTLSFSKRSSMMSRLIIAGDVVEEDPGHPMVSLMQGRYSTLSGFMLMYITQVYQELVGEAFWYLDRNRFGVPFRAFPIPPTMVYQVPADVGDDYIIRTSKGNIAIPFNDVIYFRWLDPIAPLGRGAGIGFSLRQEIGADKAAGRVVFRRFGSQAIPPAVIAISETSDMDLKSLKRYWMNEAHALWEAGVPILLNKEFKIAEMGNNFQSLQFAELRQIQRDIFINAYGIPPEIIGHQKNANRSTITAAEYLYNKLRILPRLEANCQVLQNFLAPQYEGNYIIHYDNPVDEDRDFQLRAFMAMPDTVMVDEWRTKVQGLPPLGKENGGDRFIRNSKKYTSGAFAGDEDEDGEIDDDSDNDVDIKEKDDEVQG